MAEKEKDQQEEKKGGKKLLLIIIVGVVLLLGGAGGAYFFLFAKNSPPPEEVEKQQQQSEPEVGPFLQPDPFVVNLADPTGQRYLRAKITIEFRDDKAYQMANERLPQINDAIIMVLSSKTVEEVLSPEGKLELRLELIRKLNEILGPNSVRNIYFTQFVVQ
ncbi:flagellar basal body-associated protein FliL [Thermodesulfatator indicus DSM 15286]|uniref:Flagellar protein FliL n=1 Tax=Thermodesulfatator indicus (strain DSM 15286 / JCM 11887 / CIR29812) TaxID=667014 RepID=F8A9C3_THEID|nr:flagellar basal body-associated protein FliL [Thermodesulfatator indicus]AEH44064.1 flagellar basal body-associated protein FliL [Thermodesulfatator indicus DSM 15286]